MNLKSITMLLLVGGMAFAEFSIPSDQPICNLYGLLKTFGTVVGIIVAAYSGFMLASVTDLKERNDAKALLGGVAVGLIVIWIAPLVITNLVGAESVCGWTS
ncbi:MAG: hypothetical protein AB1529_08180 [Candidatus Micrarchaeota archaeon]